MTEGEAAGGGPCERAQIEAARTGVVTADFVAEAIDASAPLATWLT